MTTAVSNEGSTQDCGINVSIWVKFRRYHVAWYGGPKKPLGKCPKSYLMRTQPVWEQNYWQLGSHFAAVLPALVPLLYPSTTLIDCAGLHLFLESSLSFLSQSPHHLEDCCSWPISRTPLSGTIAGGQLICFEIIHSRPLFIRVLVVLSNLNFQRAG